MRKVCVAVLVMVMGTLAWGQLSPEEAAKRMAELNRRAATQPVDEERIRLVRENAELKRQIVALQAELASADKKIKKLNDRISVVEASTKPTGKFADDITKGTIVAGMTLQEAKRATGGGGKRTSQWEDGSEQWEFRGNVENIPKFDPITGGQTGVYTSFTVYSCLVRGGKIVEVRQWNDHT